MGKIREVTRVVLNSRDKIFTRQEREREREREREINRKGKKSESEQNASGPLVARNALGGLGLTVGGHSLTPLLTSLSLSLSLSQDIQLCTSDYIDTIATVYVLLIHIHCIKQTP